MYPLAVRIASPLLITQSDCQEATRHSQCSLTQGYNLAIPGPSRGARITRGRRKSPYIVYSLHRIVYSVIRVNRTEIRRIHTDTPGNAGKCQVLRWAHRVYDVRTVALHNGCHAIAVSTTRESAYHIISYGECSRGSD